MRELVPITLTNRRAILTHLEYPAEKLREVFRYRVPNYYFSPKYRAGLWDGYINLLKRGALPTGTFLSYQKEVEKKLNIEFQCLDKRTPLTYRPYPESVAERICTRVYQQETVEAMIAASTCGGLIIGSTGSGKTFIAGAYLSRLQGSACFVVDELTLLDQAQKELETVLQEPVGEVGHSVFHPQRITVATIQTLHRHRARKDFLKWFSKLDVLIIDEIHVALNRRNISIVGLIAPKAVYGLTATLEMHKAYVRMRATALAGPVIYTYPLAQGVEEGVLSQGVVCAVRFPSSGRGQDYQYEYDHMIVRNRTRNDLIEQLTRTCLLRGHRVIVLVERIRHLKIFERRFHDLPHVVVYGKRSLDERREAKAAMDAGELPLIIANRVFSKGVNIRSVDVIVDGTATRSKNSALQRYGRGMRLAEGKTGLLYLDIADFGVGNRFAACARSRWKAFQAAKIQEFFIASTKPPLVIVEAAELALTRGTKQRVLPG